MVDEAVQTDKIQIAQIKDEKEQQPKVVGFLDKVLKNYKSDKLPMSEKNILTIIENALEEKYKYDQKSEKEESFPKFAYDYLLMNYGLKTIALKNLGSIQIGLQNYLKDKRYQYSEMITRLLGFRAPLKNDEARIMVKARKFFVET